MTLIRAVATAQPLDPLLWPLVLIFGGDLHTLIA
ncbi:hypothetical protein ABIB45_004141 [Arthrobacter sp. UYCo732]